MDKANDIGTLLEIKDWIHSEYYVDESSLEVRMILNSLMSDIQYTIDNLMDEMYEYKVGLDD